ncbi:M23 family metallopeptidase [Gloeobacter morelensis]|uniref:M23 family metallopeptidase n=1 Tax=Gloeobacter morelensis MG652769 TaxID=2781736 RepID=A0ABY3PJI2_9CYAN|nr:M23 family metallopeptidase [Gloeobacter morelensis]UFP93717.1 M23 family metallopeptidase [Gloeobacter morelensis MG652769]
MEPRHPERWSIRIARSGREAVVIDVRPAAAVCAAVLALVGLFAGVRLALNHFELTVSGFERTVSGERERNTALEAQAGRLLGRLEQLEAEVRSLQRQANLAPTIDATAQGGAGAPEPGAGAGMMLSIANLRLDKLSKAMRAKKTIALALAERSARPAGLPVAGARLTSGFGPRRDPVMGGAEFHSGLDFAGPYGLPIRATAPGRVSRAGWGSGWGQHVVIDHGHGFETLYAHLSRLEVRAGDSLGRGDLVGRMGSTGRSTGTHLHYTVYLDGQAVDPSPYLGEAPSAPAL